MIALRNSIIIPEITANVLFFLCTDLQNRIWYIRWQLVQQLLCDDASLTDKTISLANGNILVTITTWLWVHQN